MMDYKRIVSYLYKYERGKKGANAGYVRIEVRQSNLKLLIHAQDSQALKDKDFAVYFYFHDGERLKGIQGGTMRFHQGESEFRKETKAQAIFDSSLSLDEMSGILIYYNNELAYGTQWDDKSIQIERFESDEEPNRTKQNGAVDGLVDKKSNEIRESEPFEVPATGDESELFMEKEQNTEEPRPEQQMTGKQREESRLSEPPRMEEQNTESQKLEPQILRGRNTEGRRKEILNLEGQKSREPMTRNLNLENQVPEKAIAERQNLEREMSNKPVAKGVVSEGQISEKSMTKNLNLGGKMPEQPVTGNLNLGAQRSEQSMTGNLNLEDQRCNNLMPEKGGLERQTSKSQGLKEQNLERQAPKQQAVKEQSPEEQWLRVLEPEKICLEEPEPVSIHKQEEFFEAEEMDDAFILTPEPKVNINQPNNSEVEETAIPGLPIDKETFLGLQAIYQGDILEPTKEREERQHQERKAQIQEEAVRFQSAAESQKLLDQLLNTAPRISHPANRDILIMVRIHPQDLGRLSISNWFLGSNSFLIHGFYQFHYITIGKLLNRDSTVRGVIGVPGIYNNQERYMAAQFGFHEFVPVKPAQIKTGSFGYWIVNVI